MSCFGPHISMEIYDADLGHIEAEEVINAFLPSLAKKVGVQPISECLVTNITDTEFPCNNGYAGSVQLTSGHICIRTYPYVSLVLIDFFSRKDFDPAVMISSTKLVFGGTDFSIEVKVRGNRSLQEMIDNREN